jgi:peptidyl-prolyl cis-trans isomerase A (cyclophilin A)
VTASRARLAAVLAFLLASSTAAFAGAGTNDVGTNAPLPDLVRVRLETDAGDMELELDAKHAPVTARNFLRYVEAGHYDGGRFFRAVTMSNQPTNDVKIQVVQAEANTAHRREYFPAIPLERTRDTGLRHLDGSLSMARYGPDTARDSFSIVLGEQPEMDFGGKRNADGQGFAVFGRVTKGLEVARKIQAAPVNGQQLVTPVRIRTARRID